MSLATALATQHCSSNLERAYQAGLRLTTEFGLVRHPLYPALEQWWRELALGMRTIHDFDDLWRRACKDMESSEQPSFTRRAASPGTPPAATVAYGEDN